ncbi:mitochondrial membrane protein, variant 2 [Dermatophagoides farinae]|uniref:Mitochondrial fission 1 protein-like protein n=1 Tax=Dermatophagoides farinae TaxID=6954 RepID=A0A922HYG2_DERFA|nr:mitochondrial fission 1 protein-like isoform X2 [Dermatophagoides farinae]KAH7637312.1 mitochondrial fission 1 protein-like protein [Dermatophagoides farinae]KAH9511197.1 mitochondrial membrane protein, variant 2 [Dermatophagoides farinae]
MEERVEAMLDSNVTNSELKLHTEKFNQAMRDGKCDVDTKFQYAVTLSRSRISADHHRAITLLEDLCVSGDPEAFRDYLFYLIIVNIKLHDYVRALECAKKFLEIEPSNRQVQDLKTYAEKKRFNTGMKGLAIVGGVALAAGALVMAFKNK